MTIHYRKPIEAQSIQVGAIERIEPFGAFKYIGGERYIGVRILLGWVYAEQRRIHPPLLAMKNTLHDLIHREGVPRSCWLRAKDLFIIHGKVQ